MVKIVLNKSSIKRSVLHLFASKQTHALAKVMSSQQWVLVLIGKSLFFRELFQTALTPP